MQAEQAALDSSPGWLLGMFILAMPVMLVTFLGSQMATSRVRNTFGAYQTMPEIRRFEEFVALPQATVVMLRGRLIDTSCRQAACDDTSLLVYQKRPVPGREVRFQEEFTQSFPPFSLALEGGNVAIAASQTHQRIIQHELHTLAYGDQQHVGFRHGDVVTVQGQVAGAVGPALLEVTGISGHDKMQLMQEWQHAFRKIVWLRNITGLFTGAGLVGLMMQIRRLRKAPKTSEASWCLQ